MQAYVIKWLSQHFEKEVYQYINISLLKRTPFLRRPPSASFLQETPLLESLFNSKYCEIFKSTYFEEHLRTAASENVFMKLRNIKI